MPTIAAAGPETWVEAAVREAGGELAPLEVADGLIWTGKPAGLAPVLERASRARWIQLPSAGVEGYAGLISEERVWTCAKGAYAPQVAEHALMLALAGMRRLKERAQARSWSRDERGQSLLGEPVTVLGGGGICECLIRLLAPFGCPVTVVRRHPAPIAGALSVVGPDGLAGAVAGAALVVVAWALTPETEGVVDARLLRSLPATAWLVNVARGRHVVTDDLVRALREAWIAGAALDVTDPEPLPEGHPLWDLPNCLITPHTANPGNLAAGVLAGRVKENVRLFMEGRPLAGQVDPRLGY